MFGGVEGYRSAGESVLNSGWELFFGDDAELLRGLALLCGEWRRDTRLEDIVKWP
jgi:hypothetical protein